MNSCINCMLSIICINPCQKLIDEFEKRVDKSVSSPIQVAKAYRSIKVKAHS